MTGTLSAYRGIVATSPLGRGSNPPNPRKVEAGAHDAPASNFLGAGLNIPLNRGDLPLTFDEEVGDEGVSTYGATPSSFKIAHTFVGMIGRRGACW